MKLIFDQIIEKKIKSMYISQIFFYCRTLKRIYVRPAAISRYIWKARSVSNEFPLSVVMRAIKFLSLSLSLPPLLTGLSVINHFNLFIFFPGGWSCQEQWSPPTTTAIGRLKSEKRSEWNTVSGFIYNTTMTVSITYLCCKWCINVEAYAIKFCCINVVKNFLIIWTIIITINMHRGYL